LLKRRTVQLDEFVDIVHAVEYGGEKGSIQPAERDIEEVLLCIRHLVPPSFLLPLTIA